MTVPLTVTIQNERKKVPLTIIRSPYASFKFLLLWKFSHDWILRVPSILWMSIVDISSLSSNFCFWRLEMLDFTGESFWSVLSVGKGRRIKKKMLQLMMSLRMKKLCWWVWGWKSWVDGNVWSRTSWILILMLLKNLNNFYIKKINAY